MHFTVYFSNLERRIELKEGPQYDWRKRPREVGEEGNRRKRITKFSFLFLRSLESALPARRLF